LDQLPTFSGPVFGASWGLRDGTWEHAAGRAIVAAAIGSAVVPPSCLVEDSHGLAHVGHVAHDERVEAAPNIAFPARHGRDVGLHWGVAVGLRNLRVAA